LRRRRRGRRRSSAARDGRFALELLKLFVHPTHDGFERIERRVGNGILRGRLSGPTGGARARDDRRRGKGDGRIGVWVGREANFSSGCGGLGIREEVGRLGRVGSRRGRSKRFGLRWLGRERGGFDARSSSGRGRSLFGFGCWDESYGDERRESRVSMLSSLTSCTDRSKRGRSISKTYILFPPSP
jgi:hypothetical protein